MAEGVFMRIRLPWIIVLGALLLVFLVFAGCGRKSPPVPPGTLKPKAPEDLGYTITKKGVLLTWTVPTENVDGSPIVGLKGFEVFKAEEDLNATCAGCPKAYKSPVWVPFKRKLTRGLKMVYEDRTLTRGKRYSYRVRTVKGIFSKSASSREISFSWCPPPGAPKNLLVKEGQGGIFLTWSPPKAFEDGAPIRKEDLSHITYTVLRKEGSRKEWKVVKKRVKDLRFYDRNVTQNTIYIYRIRPVFNYWGTKIPGVDASTSPFELGQRISIPAPEGLVALPGKDGVALHWRGHLEMGQGFRVYRKGPKGLIEALNAQPLKHDSFLDRTLLPKGVYDYWVTIVTFGINYKEGPPSNIVKVKVE